MPCSVREGMVSSRMRRATRASWTEDKVVLPRLQSKARQEVNVSGIEFFRWHRKDVLTPHSDGHWPVGHDLFGAVGDGEITDLVLLVARFHAFAGIHSHHA